MIGAGGEFCFFVTPLAKSKALLSAARQPERSEDSLIVQTECFASLNMTDLSAT